MLASLPRAPAVEAMLAALPGAYEEQELPRARPYPGISRPLAMLAESPVIEAARRGIGAMIEPTRWGVGAAIGAWRRVPEPVKKPVEKVAEAGMGVLGYLAKPAEWTKRALTVLNIEAEKRIPPELVERMPWGEWEIRPSPIPALPFILRRVPEEKREARQHIGELIRELDITPAQADKLGHGHYTWVMEPEKLAQALEDVKAGIDPYEAALKHRDLKYELVGEFVLDPLNFAGIFTKPIAKVLKATVQQAKKAKPIAKLSALSKRSVANVAYCDGLDVGRSLLAQVDDAKDATKLIDDFVKNPAKHLDNLAPRGKKQAESIAEFLKASAVTGKKAVGKVYDAEKAARAMADATWRAARKAMDLPIGGDRNLYNNAQRFLAEHWLGTRPGWVVFNATDNSIKLALEGVNPFSRLGSVVDEATVAYGKAFIPAEVIEGTFGRAMRGRGELLHKKLLGPLAKPMEMTFKASQAVEEGGRLRAFFTKALGKIRGSRDDFVRLVLPDRLGPVPDDIQRLIIRDLRALEYPNEVGVAEIFKRYLRKNAPVTSGYSFADDTGKIPSKIRKVIGQKLSKATTEVDIGRIFDTAADDVIDEATRWAHEVGGPSQGYPVYKFSEWGGPDALFDPEDGADLMARLQMPHLDHEAVGALSHKLGLHEQGSHFQARLAGICDELGISPVKRWAELPPEGMREFWNRSLRHADQAGIELPWWFEEIRVGAPELQVAELTQRIEALQDTIRIQPERADELAPIIERMESQLAATAERAGDMAAVTGAAPEAARVAEEAMRPTEIVQPIIDELNTWRAAAIDDLARAGETVGLAPEAMRAIHNARDEAVKMIRTAIDTGQEFGMTEANRILGDYLRKGNMIEFMGNIVPFARWPAYNLPYWFWTFMEKPAIPAAAAKLRGYQAVENANLPERMRYTVPIPGSERFMESLGFGSTQLRFDPWRSWSIMQQTPGGTPYQARRIKEVMEDPTSPEAIMTIASQVGIRPWPWFEYLLGYKGLLGDDWYPFDLSSFEPLAKALFETDTTPSTLLREQLGLEPDKFLQYQVEKEIRGQIMRGEAWDEEDAKTRARQKGALYSFMGQITGFYPKEFTREEEERLGMTAEMRQLYADVVRETGGDPSVMSYDEQRDWAKRHGATMEGGKVAEWYDEHPEYGEIIKTWMSPEERDVGEQTSAYFDESRELREARDAALAALPIPAISEAKTAIWDGYNADLQALNERYPFAKLTPSSLRPTEVLRDRMTSALLRQLQDTQPWYDKEKYETYEEYTDDLKTWEANARDKALELWGPETFSQFHYLATPEAIGEYRKSQHNITGAVEYVYKKHIESPYWEDSKRAQVMRLAGVADWVNVKEPITKWSDYIEAAAEENEIDPRIIAAIIDLESGGNPEAINKVSGATGLMQVVPMEGRPSQEELLDPGTNITTGVAILRDYLEGASWDMQQALYQYSGGTAWSSYERYEDVYWKNLGGKFKGLWGVSLGKLRADASDEIMGQAPEVDVETLIGLIELEYPGRWTEAEIRAELEGREIRGVLEAYAARQPETTAVREVSDAFWDLRASLPPGVYRKAIDALPEVKAYLDGADTLKDVKAAVEAITEYMDEHPLYGTPAEWAQAEREHDAFRRYVYNTYGTSIYEEQNAYYAAKDAGRDPEPSERLKSYWDDHTAFRIEHPIYTKYYFPDWEPYEPRAKVSGVARAPRAARAPTQREVLEGTAKAWTEFVEGMEDKGLLELIQSWLLLTPSQRGAFLRSHPELAAWLEGRSAEFLTKLAESLAAHLSLTKGRAAAYRRRPPTLRYYRSYS